MLVLIHKTKLMVLVVAVLEEAEFKQVLVAFRELLNLHKIIVQDLR